MSNDSDRLPLFKGLAAHVWIERLVLLGWPRDKAELAVEFAVSGKPPYWEPKTDESDA